MQATRLHILPFMAAFAVIVTLGAPLKAQETVAADPNIQSVILKQLDAFRNDDAHAAFAIASSNIQERFGSSHYFMMMVRQGYASVYRPRYVEFGDLVGHNGGLFQHVVVEGVDGAIVMAVYSMIKDGTGNWRIDGCDLAPMKREST